MTDAEQDGLLEGLGGGSPESAVLIGIIHHLRGVIAELRAEVARLQEAHGALVARCARLETELEEERKNKRPAAPFRIPDEKRSPSPTKPGRRPGHEASFRPKPQHVDREVDVSLNACPQCGGPLCDVEPVEQFIEEIPSPQVEVIRLITRRGQCARCGAVRSTHPLQVSTATGAAGTHLGPNATALAASLLHDHAIPRRRVARILWDLCGLRISPGGLVHLAHRLARRLEPEYDALCQEVAEAPVLHADETSWWVGRPGWFLWVFATATRTLFRVRPSRGRAVVTETIGTGYRGVLITDCLAVYDGVNAHQQKCYAHHLKVIAETAKRAPHTQDFCSDAATLLRCAMKLKELRPRFPTREFAHERERIRLSAKRLFGPARADPAEERLANRFRKQSDHFVTFLEHDDVEATNNLAERQLRPAVISRKLSCGNRTPRGARTWEILASLAATSHQNAASFIASIRNAVSLQPDTLPLR